MQHLSAVATAANVCTASIPPEAATYQTSFNRWERKGNSGQIVLNTLEPEEGNLRLIPGDSKLRLIYTHQNQLYAFESLVLRLEREPPRIVLRMPEQIEFPRQRRDSDRVEPGADDRLEIRLPAAMQAQIPEVKAPVGGAAGFETVADPSIANISKSGIAFLTNYRLDQMKRGDIISDASVTVPEFGSFQVVLQIEHVETLISGHYRFRCGCSINYFRQPQAETAVQKYVKQRLEQLRSGAGG